MADNDIVQNIKVTADTSDAEKKLDDLAKKADQTKESVERASAAASRSGGSLSADEFTQRTAAQTFDTHGNPIASGGGSKPPPPPAPPPEPPQPPHLNPAGDEFREAVLTMREAVHALHPVLNEAGIGMGELSGVMIAARGGALALAVAIGGTLVVALEKAGDAANDASSRLGAFAGGLEKGQKQFEGLKELAPSLDSTATALAPPFEQISRINQQQGLGIDPHGLEQILSNLVKGTSADRVPEAEALKGLTGILTDIRKTGIFSESDIKALEELSPRLSQALLESIEKIAPGQIAAGTVTAPTVLKAAQAPEFTSQIEQISKDADKLPKSISTAFGDLVSASERMMEALSGGHVVSDALTSVKTFIDGLTKQIEDMKPETKSGLLGGASAGAIAGGISGFLSPVPGGAILGMLGGAAAGAVTGAGIGSVAPEPTMDPGQRLSASFDAVDESAQKTTASSHGLAEALDNVGNRAADTAGSLQRQLGAQGASLSKQQAALDLQFLPQEQASQTAHDTLGVEQAGLAQQQAAIGVAEAHKQLALASLSTAQAMVAAGDAAKQMALAQLAPQQAAVGLAQAQNQLATITATNQLRRLQEQGIDDGPGTSDEGDLARQRIARAKRDAQDIQEKQAEIAVKVAEVNLRYAGQEEAKAELAQKRAAIELQYSYLDEPKAALAAQQAETNIKSAAIEQSDASLKLAKDSAGQPIARDLAALKYAQASLEEFRKHTALQENLKTLPEILEAILNLGKGGGDKKDGSDKKDGGKSAGQQTTPDGEKPKLPADAETPAQFEARKRAERAADAIRNAPDKPPEIPFDQSRFEQDAKDRAAANEAAGRKEVEDNARRRQQEEQTAPPPAPQQPQQPQQQEEQTAPPPAPQQPQQPQPQPQQPQASQQQQQQQPTPDASTSLQSLATAADTATTSLQGIGTSTDTAKTGLDGIGTSTDTAKTGLDGIGTSTDTAKTGLDGIGTSSDTAKTGLDGVGTSSDTAKTGLDGVGTSAQSLQTALGSAASAAESMATAAQSAAAALSSVRAPGGGGARAAGGGLIRGPGSATSDSIHALLSDGEYVVKSAATAFWGADFMHAINSMRLPKFRGGGLVGFLPRFADGGLVYGNGGMPHLGTVDLRTDHGSVTMMASNSAVDQLSRLAVQKRITSTGRKPSFIG